MQEPLINNLPNELLTWIFEITPRYADNNHPGYTAWHRRLEYYPWLRFMLVCRRWRIVGERLLYRNMSLKILDEPSESLTRVTKSPHICPFARDLRLTVSLSKPVANSTLDLLRNFNAVRKLDLTGRPYKIGREILEIIRSMPLTEVSLGELPSLNMIFEFFDIPTLTHLSVSSLDRGKNFQSPPSGSEEKKPALEEEEENVSNSSPSPNTPTDTKPTLNGDAAEGTKALDELLPSSRQRTSKITSIHFSCPSTGVQAAQQLFLWPAHLEEVKISLLTTANTYEEYTAEGVQSLLTPQSESLRKIDIGVMTQGRGGIPDFSNFPRLEEVTISSYNLFHDSPEGAHQKLSAPELKRLEISFSPEELWSESLNDFGENETLWLEEFIELVKDAPETSKLKNIYVRFKPQPTYPPRDDVDEWPWDMFEELAEVSEEYGITFEYDQPEFSKRQFCYINVVSFFST
ncbi:hypothetical protein P170DRAFT_438276 [Aspergillus steynii IBT 23096]|uniref:Uncharacterized protein n=1 Tax=Aspergillus steynii IBT 23096 TaxID=1392250 RepID=A0A2I2G0U7_9EURO|nr:uncharacterized protein P170DRAFT_438276 [Aspergillus steynii IBT 23096]PLB46510.1 hypothetical protein P170DRAFT_438276 [Aspergillus steynii IBT 23096]